MSKFKEGDKVKFKEYLNVNKVYNGISLTPYMQAIVEENKTHTVSATMDDSLLLDNKLWWGEDMFELVEDDKEMPKIKFQDIRGPKGSYPCCPVGPDIPDEKPEMIDYPTELQANITPKVMETIQDNQFTIATGGFNNKITIKELEQNIQKAFQEDDKPEMVNHPQHYAFKYEPIDVINDWGLDFNLGNTVKYIARCERKGNKIQDLEKANFYLEDEIRRLKEE